MKKLEDIKEKLKEIKPQLKEKYGIKEIGIFGSYVRGEQKKKSDLDILVEFEESAEIGLPEFVHLENILSDVLGVNVDLLTKKVLKPHIGRHILKEVIYL
ncbi:MAG: nucleotidyltransferase family protein [Caldisericum sp.]|uniref:nucleotidyltransferase family protein n=1 Tax=Caldisericum sp. TaxID=2499687 RepID=UPI003D10C10D